MGTTNFDDVELSGAITAATAVIGGNTLSGTELGLVDGVTAGTTAASKVVSYDANGVADKLAAKSVQTRVYNATGGTLSQDTVVILSGCDATTGLPKVVKFDADAANLTTPDQVFIVTADILTATAGFVMTSGLSLATYNNNTGSVGDPVYASATVGGITDTAPGAGNANIVVGYKIVKSATVGQYIFTPARPVSSALNAQVVTTGAALNSYGYTQAQADALVTAVNALLNCVISAGLMSPA